MIVFHLDLSKVQLYEVKSYWKVTIIVFNGNEVLTTGVSVLREGVTCWGHGTTTAKLTWHCTPSWDWVLKYFHRGWDKTKGDFVPWNSKMHLSLREPWLFIATFQELNTFLLSPAETTCFLNPVMYSFKKQKGNLYLCELGQYFRNAHLYFPWATWTGDCVWLLPFVQVVLHTAT